MAMKTMKDITPEQMMAGPMIAKAMDPTSVVREGEQMTDRSLNNMSTPMMLDFINDMPEDMKEAMMALISTGTDFATALDIVRGNDKFVAPSPEMRANEMGALGRLMEEAIDPRSVVREGEQQMSPAMPNEPNDGMFDLNRLMEMMERQRQRDNMQQEQIRKPAMKQGINI